MSINKLDSGKFQVDIRVNNRRKRKSFKTKGEATRWLHHVKNMETHGKEWNPSPNENRTLLELLEIWFELHGKNLLDKGRKRRVIDLCNALGNPRLDDLNQETFIRYRAIRLDNGLAECTLNKELIYLSSMLNYLLSAEIINKNPLKNIKKLKEVKQELIFLDDNQISLLLNTVKKMNERTYLGCLVGFATGGRWSEIININIDNVRNSSLYYNKTKSKKSRRIPISSELENWLTRYLKFNEKLNASYETFRTAIKVTEIKLPKGQMTHVMRHSFASHYIKNGGDIIELKELLGHSTIDMTMKYAHLSPNKTNKVLRLNPISKWTL